MEAVAAELAAMREKIEKLERARQLSPKLATSSAAAMEEDENDYDENGWWKEDEEDEEEVSWETTYRANRQAPKTPGGSTLATLLESPPPISLLKSDPFTPPTFTSIPETAAPRKHWSDIKIHTPQRKLEAAMQHMVQSIDTQDP